MESLARASELPETAAVHWRPRMDAGRLSLTGWSWTASTAVQVAPMLALAVILILLDPVTIAVGVIMLVHAWAIPELYANRGAKVIKPKARAGASGRADRARPARRSRRPPGA